MNALALLSVVVPLCPAGSPTPSSPFAAGEAVILELKSGEEVEGEVTMKFVEIETDFGSAKVDVEQIATIDFGEPDAIDTRGGLRLTGKLKTKSLRLEVDGKKKTVKTRDVTRWIALIDGKRLDAADVSGEWMSNFGPMSLEQAGREVSGTYGFDGSSIEGRVNGNTLEVTYGSGGEATFELWPDGEHMAGPWENGERDGKWGAYRKAPKKAEPVPGEIVKGQTESGLRYYLRVPKDFDPSMSYDAICILHGSNMSAAAYVGTFPSAWPELTEKYVLVGFDGEQMNGWSEVGEPTYNYTYINFGGDKVGPPFAHRQSPALVAEGLTQLREELSLGRWFVGGHSQGGWLTYPVAMFYPELVAGVFPMSGGMLIQCEPTSFNDLDEQKQIAFAPIHGTNDNVVAFSSGQAGVDSLLDGDFPTMRFFTDDRAGHMFAHLPVDEAIHWLDTMTSGDANALSELADDAVKAKRWRDAAAAVMRANSAPNAADAKAALKSAREKIDKAAAKEVKRLEPLVVANKNGKWVDDFLAFRDEFAFAPSAKAMMQAYLDLRAEHQEPADKLFWGQRSEEDKDEQERMRREIVDKYYASSWYKLVKGWLDD